jgi:hypothetical protein
MSLATEQAVADFVADAVKAGRPSPLKAAARAVPSRDRCKAKKR